MNALSPVPDEDSTVHHFDITPDGTRVVFLSDHEARGIRRLYSVPVAGGPVVRLSHNDQAGGDNSVDHFYVTPDSTRVVFIGDVDTEDESQAYVVSVLGGEVTTLSEPPLRVLGGRVSPDGARLVFTGVFHMPSSFAGIYSVPLTGQPPTLLSELRTDTYEVSPDSQTVVFYGETNDPDVKRWHAVPIDGGEVLRLEPEGATSIGRSADAAAVSADSSGLFYPWQAGGGVGARLLKGDFATGASVVVAEAPDGTSWSSVGLPDVVGDHVVFRANASHNPSAVYAVDPAGGQPLDLGFEGDVNHTYARPFGTVDGSRVVVTTRSDTAGYRVFSAAFDGGAPIHLSSPPNELPGTGAANHLTTADSKRVVYSEFYGDEKVRQVFGACVDGDGAPVRLTPEPQEGFGTDLDEVVLSPDGRFALLGGDFVSEGVDRLYIADMATGESIQVDANGGLSELEVRDFAVSSDGAYVVFSGDNVLDGKEQLFSRPLF